MKRTWSQSQEYGQLGIIESVNLRNFMCHDNLSFDFDPHVNFIVGRNGSGKSAVLAAIILALGGKSGATGRHSNIKGFVKTGKSSASVSVTLKNCGDDAYKPDEYGEKIIVERHFTSEGISSYKLKSQGGRIVSTSKEELLNILSVMDIQVENPIAVMTQDISKNFLVSKNSKAEKLFQLFFKGTGLAKIQEDYTRGLQQEEEMRTELANKKSILPEMEKDIKKLKSLLDKSTKVTELKKELLWAMVIDFEKRRDEAKAALEKVEKDEADLKKKLNACENELVNVQQNATTAKADKSASSQKMASIRSELQELTVRRSSLQSEIRQVEGTYSSHERQLKKFTADVASLENIISEIKMKNQNDLNENKQKHEMVLNNLKTQMISTKAQIELMEKKKNSLRETGASIQKKIDICHAEIQEVKYSKNNVMKEKQQLIDGMADRINVFGQEMVNALREIKWAVQSRSFKVEPKGPIGLYIKVKQPEWNFAVQECLKSGFLKTFLCDNHADADRLGKIINKHFQRNPPSIITTKFSSEAYDVSSHKTVCDHPTLLDMLDVEDPIVINALIDQKVIENILLIADEKEARSLMLYRPPRSCRVAYTPNGDEYSHSPYRNYSCRNRNRICLLRTVNEEDIKKKDEELKTLDATKAEKMNDNENLVQHLKQTEVEIGMMNNEITNLKIQLKSIWGKINEEENSYEEPKDVNCLQIDLEQLQKAKKFHEEKFTASQTELTQKKEESDALETKVGELQRILQVESRSFHSLCEKVDECENKKEKFNSAVKRIHQQLKQIEPALNEHKTELRNLEATVQLATKNAEETSERIQTRRSPDTIRQILKETEKCMQQQRNNDQQAILKEYAEKVQNLKKKKGELDRLEKINARLSDMLQRRFQDFQKTCNNTAVSLTCCFTIMLKENNFSGLSVVNFDQQTLQILAKPKKTSTKLEEFSNLTQLSGGERSYVTIAFLLSLWDRINMPIRILDEYDVFMDSANRHLSINLLVNTAKTNKKIQYIFLSPLELPDIEESDHIKVHKMPAPRN